MISNKISRNSDKIYEKLHSKWGKLINALSEARARAFDEAKGNFREDNDLVKFEKMDKILFDDYYNALSWEEGADARAMLEKELRKSL